MLVPPGAIHDICGYGFEGSGISEKQQIPAWILEEFFHVLQQLSMRGDTTGTMEIILCPSSSKRFPPRSTESTLVHR